MTWRCVLKLILSAILRCAAAGPVVAQLMDSTIAAQDALDQSHYSGSDQAPPGNKARSFSQFPTFPTRSRETFSFD